VPESLSDVRAAAGRVYGGLPLPFTPPRPLPLGPNREGWRRLHFGLVRRTAPVRRRRRCMFYPRLGLLRERWLLPPTGSSL